MGPKRKSLTFGEKIEIIHAVKSGTRKQTDIVKAYGIPQSSLSTIMKHSDRILSYHNEVNPVRKKIRWSKYEDIEVAVLEWVKTARRQYMPITIKILAEKANQFAEQLGIEFSASNSWVSRFKQRHAISMKADYFASDAGIAEKWRESNFPDILARYNPSDIFNANETGLFFRLPPNLVRQVKSEQCLDGSSDRITVMACTNMDGSEKLKLFVINNSEKQVKSLPVHFYANKRTLMTSELFTQWLKIVDSEMTKKHRKILLMIENCPAHPNVYPLESVELLFLPPNAASLLQPLDQGITRNLKLKYSHRLIEHYLSACKTGNDPSQVNVLDAVEMIHSAWEEVKQSTIAGCFSKAGFFQTPPKPLSDDVSLLDNGDNDAADNIPLSLQIAWQELRTHISDLPSEIEDFVNIDNEIITRELTGLNNYDDVVENCMEKCATMKSQGDADNDGEIIDIPQGLPSAREALSSLNEVYKFIQSTEGVTDNVFQSISVIDNFIMQEIAKKNQEKIAANFNQ